MKKMRTNCCGSFIPYAPLDRCDCDERCSKCGKKKKLAQPWTITCNSFIVGPGGLSAEYTYVISDMTKI